MMVTSSNQTYNCTRCGTCTAGPCDKPDCEILRMTSQVPRGCTCGEPGAVGVLHRSNGPCYVNEAALPVTVSQPVEAVPEGEQFLVYAWGETPLPDIAIVSREMALSSIKQFVYGDEAENDDLNLLPAFERCLEWPWEVRFEIGGIRVEPVFVSRIATPTEAPASQPVAVDQGDANNYCRILSILGMEEEGDPVEEVRRLFDLASALEGDGDLLIERAAQIAETPIAGEQDDITMAAKDRVAAAIRSLRSSAPASGGEAVRPWEDRHRENPGVSIHDHKLAEIAEHRSRASGGEALLEAVDSVLDKAPCDCSDKRRFEKGEHVSSCYLFDLNVERIKLLDATKSGSVTAPAAEGEPLPEGWKATHMPPWSALTPEANAEKRIYVERVAPPYSDKQDMRLWSGPTLAAALKTAHEALGLPISATEPAAEGARQIVCTSCNGAGVIGTPGMKCPFCPATEPVKAEAAQAKPDLSGLMEDARTSIERAAGFLEHYVAYMHEVKPDDIERHPYLPSVEESAEELRALLAHPVAQAKPEGEGV